MYISEIRPNLGRGVGEVGEGDQVLGKKFVPLGVKAFPTLED